jgi:hypothetical protein
VVRIVINYLFLKIGREERLVLPIGEPNETQFKIFSFRFFFTSLVWICNSVYVTEHYIYVHIIGACVTQDTGCTVGVLFPPEAEVFLLTNIHGLLLGLIQLLIKERGDFEWGRTAGA